MAQIERLQFAVSVGLANSFRVFLRSISSDKVVKELLASAASRKVAAEILQKILSLSSLGVDFRYLNRYDIPLAAYLWVLSRTHPELAIAGAEAIARLPRTWWAQQVARYVLEGLSNKATTASSSYTVVVPPGSSSVTTSNVTATNAQFFPGQVGVTATTQWTEGQATSTATSVMR
jgi:hypothetical protein